MKKRRGGQNSAYRNYRALGREESGIARDPASGHTVRRAGGVLRVFAAGGLHRGGEAMHAVSSHFSQRTGSGADLHGVLAGGAGGSATIYARQSAACRHGAAPSARHVAFSQRRYPAQLVQAFWAGGVPAIFLGP